MAVDKDDDSVPAAVIPGSRHARPGMTKKISSRSVP